MPIKEVGLAIILSVPRTVTLLSIRSGGAVSDSIVVEGVADTPTAA